MRSAPADAASSKTRREPSTFSSRVASPASRIAKARWTTTSAPFTSSRTLLSSVTSPWRYSVFFQPSSSGSNGRRAMPTTVFTRLERSSAFTTATPRSPVGPVTATLRLSVAIAGLPRKQHLGAVALVDHARQDRLDLAATRGVEQLRHRACAAQLLQVLDRREHEHEVAAPMFAESIHRAQPARVDALAAVGPGGGAGRRLGGEEPGVEAHLHLLGRDPPRERHERLHVLDPHARLLLELAQCGHARVVLALDDGAAGEDPGAAHEALLRVALHQQHLRAVGRVAQQNEGRSLPGLGHIAPIELFTGGRPIHSHRSVPYAARERH